MRPMTLPAKWAVAASFLLASACSTAPETTAPISQANAERDAHAPQQVAAWFAKASPEVLALPQTVFADNDESTNQLVFGVEHAGVARGVETALSRLGIPKSAYRVVVTPPIVLAVGLRDRWRPTRAGIQIHFGQYVCSLGFNADFGSPAERSFVTASHCTNKQGGVEGTQYYQPLSSVDPAVIAVEVDDPSYNGSGGCPRGRKCRTSDASRALYSSGAASDRGLIARTSGPNNGSLEVLGTFSITAQDDNNSTAVGQVVNKVGRTTGWTQGTVVGTCVDVNVSGTNIQQRCQTLVSSATAVIVKGGDSGSPTFRITGNTDVTLVGVLWGGSSDGTMFVYSPLKNIQDELGVLNATTSDVVLPPPPPPPPPSDCVPKGPNGNNCK